MRSKTLNFSALAVCLGLLFAPCTTLVQAKSVAESVVVAPIALQDLPKEGQETYLLIRQGGPFRYEKDGVVFGNRERLLPQAKRGFTANTPSKLQVKRAVAPVELYVEGKNLACQNIVFTRKTTTAVLGKL